MTTKTTLFRSCVFVIGAGLFGATSAQAGWLPDVAALTKKSDYTVFMQNDVPAEARSEALRQLWHATAADTAPDDLSDYGDDYRTGSGSVVSSRSIARPAADTEARPVAVLPTIESLNGQASYADFMQAGVPAELRTQALRQLWRDTAADTVPDDLSDYSDDYRSTGDDLELVGAAGKAPGNV